MYVNSRGGLDRRPPTLFQESPRMRLTPTSLAVLLAALAVLLFACDSSGSADGGSSRTADDEPTCGYCPDGTKCGPDGECVQCVVDDDCGDLCTREGRCFCYVQAHQCAACRGDMDCEGTDLPHCD